VAEDMDVLSLLRAFSQGDGRVLRKLNSRGLEVGKESTALSFAMADASYKYGKLFALNSFGVLKTVDFYTNYWVISFRLRGAMSAPSNYHSYVQSDALEDTVSGIRKSYASLQAFVDDSRRGALELRYDWLILILNIP
jgi:hypothetical protein